MKVDANAGRPKKGKPGLLEHCERLTLRADTNVEAELLSAIYRGIVFGHWNGLRDIIDESAVEDMSAG